MRRIIGLALIAMLSACSNEAQEKERMQRSADRSSREEAFYKTGPVVTSELKTGDGTFLTIETPILDIVPMIQRCNIFVGNSGAQSMSCSEPTSHFIR